MHEGVEGLVRDKTRPARIASLEQATIERVVELTQGPPPGEATHWTAPAMAWIVGISVSSVHRIWRAHGLQPHRVRLFKLSKDPEFVPKLRDIVELFRRTAKVSRRSCLHAPPDCGDTSSRNG